MQRRAEAPVRIEGSHPYVTSPVLDRTRQHCSRSCLKSLFLHLAEQKKQKLKELQQGIDESEALVSMSGSKTALFRDFLPNPGQITFAE